MQSRTVAAQLAERGIATTMLGVTTTRRSRSPHARSTRSATSTFSSKNWRGACANGAPTTPCIRARISRARSPATCGSRRSRERDDPRDAFCSERYAAFEALPAGARVGTSSPRRRAQLPRCAPICVYEDLRGNVDTRLRKLRDGEYDAIVLAMAGLEPLARSRRRTSCPFPSRAGSGRRAGRAGRRNACRRRRLGRNSAFGHRRSRERTLRRVRARRVARVARRLLGAAGHPRLARRPAHGRRGRLRARRRCDRATQDRTPRFGPRRGSSLGNRLAAELK